MSQNILDDDLKTSKLPPKGIDKYEIGTQFLIWIGIFFGCTILISKIVQELMQIIYRTDNIVSIVKTSNNFKPFYYLQMPTTIASFLVPAFIFSFLKDRKIMSYLNINVFFQPYLFFLIPMMLYTFYIGIVYPSFFINRWMFWSNWLKVFQDEYKYITDNMLNDTSVVNLVLCLVAVAILPAICEEFLFRGTLQKLFSERMNIHIAILLSSFIFSFIHFDFSAFLPRIILGMFLGYLFYYSGSLWLSVFAHAVNNGSQVVMMYLNKKGIYKVDVDNPTMPAVWEIVVYTIAFAVLWMLFYHFAQKNKKTNFA
jgi:hypothetical protein